MKRITVYIGFLLLFFILYIIEKGEVSSQVSAWYEYSDGYQLTLYFPLGLALLWVIMYAAVLLKEAQENVEALQNALDKQTASKMFWKEMCQEYKRNLVPADRQLLHPKWQKILVDLPESRMGANYCHIYLFNGVRERSCMKVINYSWIVLEEDDDFTEEQIFDIKLVRP